MFPVTFSKFSFLNDKTSFKTQFYQKRMVEEIPFGLCHRQGAWLEMSFLPRGVAWWLWLRVACSDLPGGAGRGPSPKALPRERVSLRVLVFAGRRCGATSPDVFSIWIDQYFKHPGPSTLNQRSAGTDQLSVYVTHMRVIYRINVTARQCSPRVMNISLTQPSPFWIRRRQQKFLL